ncbi:MULTISPECIES: pirin family protein [unclassified Treponema]|uniref:pirin family protein n=1 Tax=unclassified Treponema TaxID=2638727 RepID=UPI0020A43D68|nr:MULTISPECIES: pirin family protein [unclassified Treponema]UTC67313.1 pirin family protein [Treponema sp. OMZ 789]UTC70041.1 pirin family protein [Treponema sp. OMZ 790]UTC72757.1 pirin family protein [Treponema sp. OMZ 791]
MERKIKTAVTGFPAQDGAGVHLVRVLGHSTTSDFDPILMLDSFDSTNPDDYTAGFPMHPHRGIETISYVYKGKMQHKDSLGFEDTVGDGEVQWMTAGKGILHEEKLPASERLLGVQLWLNLPAAKKMVPPEYRSIKNAEIKEIPFDGGFIRLLAGSYKEHAGFKSKYLPLNYYDITLNAGAEITIETEQEDSVMLFTLLSDAVISGQTVKEKTAVKLTEGNSVTIKAGTDTAKVLFVGSKTLNESIAWGGPIVMNTREELQKAFSDLHNGTFI